MAQNDHQFHVKAPFQATIQLVDMASSKKAPIFIESLNDQHIVFHSHLKFPIKHNEVQVPYEFIIDFLDSNFVLQGVLLRDLTAEKATIYTFEGKFNISESERSRLFQLLSRYTIMVHKLQKEALEKKIPKQESKKSKTSFSRLV